MSDQVLYYRPARSVVAVTGTVTITNNADGDQSQAITREVTLATEADTKNRWDVELKEAHFGHDREFDLKLTPDERLAGVTNTSTGVGTELLSAGIRLAALTVSGVLTFMGFTSPETAEIQARKQDIERHFEKDNPELSERRTRYQDIIRRLDAELQRLANESVQGSRPDELYSHLKTIQSALDAATSQAATIEARFEQWLQATYPPWVRHYSYLLGTDELPVIDKVTDENSFPVLNGMVSEVAETLGIVVARVGDEAKAEQVPAPRGTPVISFRFPRRITLAVYEATETKNAAVTYRLRNIIPAWIVDRFSELGSVRIESHLFHASGATIEFGDAGTLTHLSNKETSAVGTIAKTLSGAGAAIEESIGQGAKIVGALKPADPSLSALQDQVTVAELQARLVKAQETIAGGVTSGNGSA